MTDTMTLTEIATEIKAALGPASRHDSRKVRILRANARHELSLGSRQGMLKVLEAARRI